MNYWQVIKPLGPGGPGFKVRRYGFMWRWVAWPSENASDPAYFTASGCALTYRAATQTAEDACLRAEEEAPR